MEGIVFFPNTFFTSTLVDVEFKAHRCILTWLIIMFWLLYININLYRCVCAMLSPQVGCGMCLGYNQSFLGISWSEYWGAQHLWKLLGRIFCHGDGYREVFFSIAGTYKNLLASNVQRKLESDVFTWKVMTPQRVRIFPWLLARDKLLTNEERARRGMSNYPFCDRYGLDLEFAIHVVRDCGFAQAVWKSVVPRSSWSIFFNLPIVKWIICNIRNVTSFNFWNGKWGSFYSIVCWFLWKN